MIDNIKLAHECAMAMIESLLDAGPDSRYGPFSGMKHDNNYYGICQCALWWFDDQRGIKSFGGAVNEFNSAMREAAMYWPKWSGDHGYPIPPSNPKMSAIAAYYVNQEARTLWKGHQRALRLELLTLIEDVLSKRLAHHQT